MGCLCAGKKLRAGSCRLLKPEGSPALIYTQKLSAAARSCLLRYGCALSLALGLAVFCSIWIPEFLHWYVPHAVIDDATVRSAQVDPPDAILKEASGMSLSAASLGDDSGHTLSRANDILLGVLRLPGFEPTRISRPLSLNDMTRGQPTWQLLVASLASTDTLLDAYNISGRENYFEQARDDIVSFAKLESSQWVNSGFIWNDHAISARVPVLIKFWQIYRNRHDFDPDLGRAVLGLVRRSGVMLTKDSHYAFRTGHGIISDLANLQLAIAFPSVNGSDHFRSRAAQRFTKHLEYYISNEGITLLHSAGYHSTGLRYFGAALRLFTLSGIPIPEDWWRRYERAIDFYGKLRRPDGTLPMYGDTRSVSDGNGPPLTSRAPDGQARTLAVRQDWATSLSDTIYPVSGHSIWWDNGNSGSFNTLSQTVVTWSFFPGLGHKLADDLSTIIWAAGRSWVTNVGYWPYGFPGRAQATSWPGSNAPHLDAESANSLRVSTVNSAAASEKLKFIDLTRSGPQDFSVRRQIVHLPRLGTWIVLDDVQGKTPGGTVTNWTFAHDLVASQNGEQFQLVAPEGGAALWLSIDGSVGLKADLLTGSRAPFAGWMVLDRTPVAAPTISVRRQPGSGWSMATFIIAAIDWKPLGATEMVHWRDSENWTIAARTQAGTVEITREGQSILFREAMIEPGRIDLKPVPMPIGGRAEIINSLTRAEAFYPRFFERISYRQKISLWLSIVLVVQELLFWQIRRTWPNAVALLRLAALAAWFVGGLWIFFIYFEAMY